MKNLSSKESASERLNREPLKLIRNAGYSVTVSLFERPDGSLLELTQSSEGDFYWTDPLEVSEDFNREKYLREWNASALQSAADGFGPSSRNLRTGKNVEAVNG